MALGPDRTQKVVQMEPMDVSADSKDDQVATAAINARDQAKRDKEQKDNTDIVLMTAAVAEFNALQANYGVMVMGACNLFSSFAKKKIAEKKPEGSAWELLGPVLELVGAVLAPELAPLVIAEEGLGQTILEKTIEAGSKAFASAAEGALKSEGNELEKGVDVLVEKSQLISDALRSKAIERVLTPMKKVLNLLQSKKPITDEQRSMVDLFYNKDTDAVMETLGLPREQTAKKIQMKVFAGMVKAFEKQRMLLYQKEHDLTQDERDDEQVAGQHASEAVKEYEEQMEEEARKH